MAVAADFDFAPFGKEVDHFDADAVQPAGRFVGLLVEFSAELELVMTPSSVEMPRSGWVSTGMPRPSSETVIEPSTFTVTLDVVCMAGHGFVDRVVDGFVDQVVQAGTPGIADVHAGAFADVLQVGQIFI